MDHTADNAQFEKMTTAPVHRLILSLAAPTIVSMLITAIYNTADTFFVSRIGTSATGAVGVVFSLMAMIQAIGFTIGMGSGSNISRLLGKQDYDEATKIASSGFFTALTIGAIFGIVGITNISWLMRILGSTDTILPYAISYGKYILIGAPIMCTSLLLNNILRAQGKAALGMIGITTGGILNMMLDPLFIFVFEMGVAGAAIATILSQCVSFCILISFYLRGKTTVRLTPKAVSRDIATYGRIIKAGLPSLSRQGLGSVAAATLNAVAGNYGDAAVAGMAIVNRVYLLINSVMIGFGQGYQPVCGFNYGAKKYDRVKEGFWFEVKVGFVIMVILTIIGMTFSESIVRSFSKNDPLVLAIGVKALRIQCSILCLEPVVTMGNMMFQMTGKSFIATYIAAAKQGTYFLPLVLILSRTLGLLGLQMAQAVSTTLTFISCVPFIYMFFKQMDRETKCE